MSVGYRVTRIASHKPTPALVGLALPKGPTILSSGGAGISAWTQLADLYDTVGINFKPENHANSDASRAAAITAVQELGVRHMRRGFWSPATHSNSWDRSQLFDIACKAAGLDCWMTYGTPEEPAYRAQVNGEVYTITDSNGSFLRDLDMDVAEEVVSTEFFAVDDPKWPGEKKWSGGRFRRRGWEMAGGLQGPNEPANFRTPARTFYEESIRNDVMRAFMSAKRTRTQEPILGGQDYVNNLTGRITPGPAYAPQIPVICPSLASMSTTELQRYGDYTNGDADAGSFAVYWGGHEPNWPEAWQPNSFSMRGERTPYNGFLFNGVRYSREIPIVVGETGYYSRPDADQGPGKQRYCPPHIAGIYLNRSILHNYCGPVRRTFLYKLNDEDSISPYSLPPMGLCDQNWVRYASFHQVANFMALIGFVQGPDSPPPAYNHSGFTPGPVNTHTYESGAGPYTSPDRLTKIIGRGPGYDLVIFARDRMLWDRGAQQEVTVADPQTISFTVPAGSTVERALPERNTVLTPDDGLTYPGDDTDGREYHPMTVNGSNAVEFDIAALTQIFKVTPP